MKAIDYLISLPREWLPRSTERGKTGLASKSEIKRWLLNKAVIINGKTPLPQDEISFPIRELIFFPKGNKRTTIYKESN